MQKLSDADYLLNEQYKTPANLDARIALHARFSVNKYGWFPWVFDQFSLPPRCRILELGCGPGDLWAENLARIPDGWDITPTDFSPGMVDKAREKLQRHNRFRFAQVDAQSIPHADGAFDAVIANHMLYHVPDRPKALAEMRRVLVPGGRLHATTVGRDHLRDLYELVRRLDAERELTWWHEENPFVLENGAEQLAPWFSEIEIRRYEDGLVITEVEPLVAYVMSSSAGARLTGDKPAEFRALAERELAAHGAIQIHKDSGIFLAVRNDSPQQRG
jgi:ubiquinone/menaquinone biosynthesis C-methylase UbiE